MCLDVLLSVFKKDSPTDNKATESAPSDKMTITLYFLQTSRAIRTAWLLEELGLDYNVEYHDREANMDTPSSYRTKPGMAEGRSPGISDGDVNLIESGAIAE